MTRKSRAPFVALVQLLTRRFPELNDPVEAVVDGRVLVDGRTVANPDARVRRDASIRLVEPRRLRGHTKLLAALDAFGLDVTGLVAVDAGAAAGGFTSALLDRGAVRVYAVDAGFGQLRGGLRRDSRVVNLERTNIGDLDDDLVPDDVALVTMDLSYLPVADAVRLIGHLRYVPGAFLAALVKPTFELRRGSLVTDSESVREAIRTAGAAIDASGWRTYAVTIPAVTGAHGAIEAFVLAQRTRDTRSHDITTVRL